jgi:7,8-dihydropterin-6-yl-methyl-4-(beta-D-ribofuranosyl)aminobenzene 5'-phosphate synthase
VEDIASGHCTGEPTFAALKQAFGDHYIYAGVGTSLATGSGAGRQAKTRRSTGTRYRGYRRLAAREDPFGLATWRRKLANTETDRAPPR